MQVHEQHGVVDMSGHEATLRAAESQLSAYKGIVIQLEKVCVITFHILHTALHAEAARQQLACHCS